MLTSNNGKLPRSFTRTLLVIVSSILFGLAWFIFLHGRFPLYVSHVDWIYSFGSDTLQHYLGWAWFRQDPWGASYPTVTPRALPYLSWTPSRCLLSL